MKDSILSLELPRSSCRGTPARMVPLLSKGLLGVYTMFMDGSTPHCESPRCEPPPPEMHNPIVGRLQTRVGRFET